MAVYTLLTEGILIGNPIYVPSRGHGLWEKYSTVGGDWIAAHQSPSKTMAYEGKLHRVSIQRVPGLFGSRDVYVSDGIATIHQLREDGLVEERNYSASFAANLPNVPKLYVVTEQGDRQIMIRKHNEQRRKPILDGLLTRLGRNPALDM